VKKILIANRGEIAVRIIRACRDVGYTSIAIASDADREALYTRLADEVHHLPGTSPAQTYLNQSAIIELARAAGAEAIHPGYGLLSENAEFAQAVQDAGLVWIGPSASAINLLGDKVAARQIAREVGAPLLPSVDDENLSAAQASEFASSYGFPVIIKAQNGGGGRGMRIVRSFEEIEPQLAAAIREATIAFGRPECFIERYIERARHVETQCLADRHGNVVVLSTRDCTLQRRQQKLVEEAPAPFLTSSQVEMLTSSSKRILQAVEYQGAATVEFLVTPEGEIYFLEVNTRVQVEHPVTEQITGIDIICEMFKIAEGDALAFEPASSTQHAIEFRINAEDPWKDFSPTPGLITNLQLPAGPGVRVDFGYAQGDVVPPYYDSLVGKLIVTGTSREQAIKRARRALDELRIAGIKTIQPLHRAILERDEFTASDASGFNVYTRWIDSELEKLCEVAEDYSNARKPSQLALPTEAANAQEAAETESSVPRYRAGVKAPLSGLILEILVSEGDMVSVGDTVAIMESMKMEQSITSEVSGTVSKVNVAVGEFIEMDNDILGVD